MRRTTPQKVWTIVVILFVISGVVGLILMPEDSVEQKQQLINAQMEQSAVEDNDAEGVSTGDTMFIYHNEEQADARLGSICDQSFTIAENETQLVFDVVDDYAVMSGPLNTDAPDLVDDLIAGYPEVKTLVMTYVPGSDDDDANAEAIRKVYDQGFNICLPDNAEIASGGVDFFLAGRSREIGKNTFIGVHSWADEDDIEGGDLPRNDPQHQVYLDLFSYIQVDPDFYWFTLAVAPADDIHDMTQTERDRFNLDNYVQ